MTKIAIAKKTDRKGILSISIQSLMTPPKYSNILRIPILFFGRRPMARPVPERLRNMFSNNNEKDRLPKRKQWKMRVRKGRGLLKKIRNKPVGIINNPAYRVKQVTAQMIIDNSNQPSVRCRRYFEMQVIKKRISRIKTVSDQSNEYTSCRAGLSKMQRSKSRLYKTESFVNAFIMPPPVYNNEANKIPFQTEPNCRGSSRVMKETILNKKGYPNGKSTTGRLSNERNPFPSVKCRAALI